MRKSVSVTILLFIAVVGTFGQSDKRIAAIRSEVDVIERDLAKYSKTSKQLDGISLDAEGVYYRSAEGVRKVVAKIFGKTGRSENEYYYRGAKMIYALHQWTKFDRSIEEGPVKPAKIVVTVVYFDAGEPFAMRVDDKAVTKDSDEWKEKMYSVIATSTIYLNRM